MPRRVVYVDPESIDLNAVPEVRHDDGEPTDYGQASVALADLVATAMQYPLGVWLILVVGIGRMTLDAAVKVWNANPPATTKMALSLACGRMAAEYPLLRDNMTKRKLIPAECVRHAAKRARAKAAVLERMAEQFEAEAGRVKGAP